MITVFTQTPDELIKSLKTYFLMKDRFVIITIPEEIDDYLDTWFDMYDGEVDENNRITFKRPFLILTEEIDIFNDVVASFNTKTFKEITDILNDSEAFIESGFLPLDHEIINHYIVSHDLMGQGRSVEHVILSMFEVLGYLTQSHAPTDLLITTLFANDDTVKYAQHLSLFMTNYDITSFTDNPAYISTIIEILKLIDINIHEAVIDSMMNDSTTDSILIDSTTDSTTH